MADQTDRPTSPVSVDTEELVNQEGGENFYDPLPGENQPAPLQPGAIAPVFQPPVLQPPAGQQPLDLTDLKEVVRDLAGMMGDLTRQLHIRTAYESTDHRPQSSTPFAQGDVPRVIPAPGASTIPPQGRVRQLASAFDGGRPGLQPAMIPPSSFQSVPRDLHWPAPQHDHRKPRVPRDFEGKDETWEDYWHHFRGVSMWNNWGEEDQRRGLYIALKGAAADLVYNTPESDNYSLRELSDLLESRFGADRKLTADKKALRQRVKQKGETYHTLGDDVIRLARRVYKCSPELANREGIDAYIQALPANLRLSVASANPSTVRECVELVERLCSVLDQNEMEVETKRVRRVGSNNNSNNSNNQSNNQQRSSQNTGWCWDCGQAGHRRNKCPQHFKYKPKDNSTGPPVLTSVSDTTTTVNVSSEGNEAGVQ